MQMRKYFLIGALAALSFTSCLNIDTKCCEHVGTSTISKGLFVEKYKTFCAGVFGDLTECFITDSLTFRQKIGSYDEHERFFAVLDKDKIIAYNFQVLTYSDTTEKKSLSRNEIFKMHQVDENCLTNIPLFGKNLIKCDDNTNPMSSYKNEDGYYISDIQHHCDSSYLDAIYYIDTAKFSVFVGVNEPGSFENNYSVKLDNNSTFNFYNITFKQKIDTTKTETFLLTDLKEGKLVKVCK